ncbi:MAG: adenylate kinase [Cyanobacteria bacterium P01_H01_bin.58]
MTTRLIFLGPPGAGKGTQAKKLSGFCHVPHISTGDILRTAVAHKTDLGKKAKHYMDAGELVPDELILDLIRERLTTEDALEGWILDGFPRNVDQATFLSDLLVEIDQPFDCAVNLEVPDEVIVSRLVQRGAQEGRSDDTEETIKNRLEVYRKRTEPLIDFYRGRQKLFSVDGNRPVEVVAEELVGQLFKSDE